MPETAAEIHAAVVKRFGGDYLAYKQSVPRWIPKLRGWPTQPPGHDTKTP